MREGPGGVGEADDAIGVAFGVRADAEDVGEEVRGEHLQYGAGRRHGSVVQDGEGGDAGGADQVEQFEP